MYSLKCLSRCSQLLPVKNFTLFNSKNSFSLIPMYASSHSLNQKSQSFTWNNQCLLSNPHERTFSIQSSRYAHFFSKYTDSYKDIQHSHIWFSERILSVCLLVSFPFVAVYESQFTECIFILFTVFHVHWGLENILTDYLRTNVVGKYAYIYIDTITAVVSTVLLFSLLWQSCNGQGVLNTIAQIWRLDPYTKFSFYEKLGF